MTPIQQLQYKKLIKQYSNAEWKYIAIDHDGGVFLYTGRPDCVETDLLTGFGGHALASRIHDFECEIDGWKDTLVELQ
jgi:hypothetical protein